MIQQKWSNKRPCIQNFWISLILYLWSLLLDHFSLNNICYWCWLMVFQIWSPDFFDRCGKWILSWFCWFWHSNWFLLDSKSINFEICQERLFCIITNKSKSIKFTILIVMENDSTKSIILLLFNSYTSIHIKKMAWFTVAHQEIVAICMKSWW